MDDLEVLADEIDRDSTVVAFTGAGISAPSGVPTFRGDDGVWERFDEGQFAYGRFRRDPAGFWEDRLELQEAMFGDGYEPNVAHEALAELGREGYLDAILTQNTDGLHGRALRSTGSESTGGDDRDDEPDASSEDTALLELHGNSQSSGATLGIVNLESTPSDDAAAVVCRENVTAVLPALQEMIVE